MGRRDKATPSGCQGQHQTRPAAGDGENPVRQGVAAGSPIKAETPLHAGGSAPRFPRLQFTLTQDLVAHARPRVAGPPAPLPGTSD